MSEIIQGSVSSCCWALRKIMKKKSSENITILVIVNAFRECSQDKKLVEMLIYYKKCPTQLTEVFL